MPKLRKLEEIKRLPGVYSTASEITEITNLFNAEMNACEKEIDALKELIFIRLDTLRRAVKEIQQRSIYITVNVPAQYSEKSNA
jgi:hypothetical protein